MSVTDRQQKKLKDLVRAQLQPEEAVTAHVFGEGTDDDVMIGPAVILALTDRRVVGVVKHLTGPITHSWSFEDIQAVSTRKGALGGGGLVFKLDADAFLCRKVRGADAEAFRHAIEQRLQSVRAGGATRSDTVARLQSLKEMLDRGLIDATEFAAKREQVLSEV